MNQPRPSRPDPASLYQPGRNPPPANTVPPGNVMMYNPNQYNPGNPPSNGSWGPPRQQAPQQQHIPPPKQDSWDWDENVNNFQNYPEAVQTAAAGPKIQNVLLNNPPSMYSVPDYSANQAVPPSYPPENAVNNNQYDLQPAGANQNWGWNDGEDWGWNNEYQQQSSQHQIPLPTVENQQGNFQTAPPSVNSGLESGFSTLSLSNAPVKEETPQVQERPSYSLQQQQPPPTMQAEETNSWSRVPTWGSALDHEQGSYESGSEQPYPRELGERNTFADGASFTDPSLPLPSNSLGNGQIYTPTAAHTIQSEPPNLYTSSRSVHPPPSTLNLGDMAPTIEANIVLTETGNVSGSAVPEPGTVPVAPSPSLSAHRINSGPPYGSTEGFNSGPVPTGPTYNISEYPGAPTTTSGLQNSISELPIGNRLPGSGSRSQSGTPSMERESERPDAEGGYENDQPTPLFSQTPAAPYGAMAERKVVQESPAGSRPSSRQAGSTPSSESPSANPSPYHMPGDVSAFVRPKPVSTAGSFYPTVATSHVTASPPISSTVPTVARGSQEAVGSEFGPPVSAVPLSRADGMTASSSMLPPSSQRMIPGSGSQGPPLLSMAPIPQQQQPQQQLQSRPAGTVTPVAEQRIVTGFAKNDPVPVPPAGQAAPLLATTPQGPPSLQQAEEVRTQSLNRSPPPPHRSETIGSENPRANLNSAIPLTGGTGGGNGSADRSDDRISDRDRDREIKPHDRGSRVERNRGKFVLIDCYILIFLSQITTNFVMADRDDYDRDGRNRYPEDDEDERFSTSYRERDRRYDGDRDGDREHRDSRRYEDRDRGYSRQDYDDDRRSGYGPSDRDRARDPRRRDTRRFVFFSFFLIFPHHGSLICPTRLLRSP